MSEQRAKEIAVKWRSAARSLDMALAAVRRNLTELDGRYPTPELMWNVIQNIRINVANGPFLAEEKIEARDE